MFVCSLVEQMREAVQSSDMASQSGLPARILLAVLVFFSASFIPGDARLKNFRRFGTWFDSEKTLGNGSTELWFAQRLDHFNGADSRMWKQVRNSQVQSYYVCNAFGRLLRPVSVVFNVKFVMMTE